MDRELIKEMISDLIMEIDYDHWKFLMPQLSEDYEAGEKKMEQLISIVERYVD